MTIDDLIEEYYNLTIERKRTAFHNIVDALEDAEMDELLVSALDHLQDLEIEDYFGTEGADI